MGKSKTEIIKRFVRAFVEKSSRERAVFELENKRGSFINKLNHRIEVLFDLRKLIAVDAHPELIKKELKISSKTMCYVICHNDDLDDSIIEFNSAFDQLFGNGLGFCLILIDQNLIYIEGEYVRSGTERFIGVVGSW